MRLSGGWLRLCQWIGRAFGLRGAFSLCMAIGLASGASAEMKAAETKAASTAPSAAPGTVSPAAESGAAEAMRLTRLEGSAESAVVDWVLNHSGPLKGDTRAGEFRVAFTLTPAEGWWEMAGEGKLAWHEAPANHVHLRVFVLDRRDGRLVPGLTVGATVIDVNGNELPAAMAFGWYPLLNAYGGNIPLSSDGSYRFRIRIAAPVMRTVPPSESEKTAERDDGMARLTTVEFPAMTILQNEVMLLPLATQTGFSTEAELLKPGNDALSAGITALWQQSAAGDEKPARDYFVAYALGEAAPARTLGRLRRKGLLDFGSKENTWLEVLVLDSRTGRPIPALTPHASLIADGDPFDGGELTPVRRPWLDVYGRTVRMPRKGSYKLRVWFDAPGFRRWGRQSERFAQPAEVEFEDLTLNPEPKPEPKPKSGTTP
jgi:hypothetical protein